MATYMYGYFEKTDGFKIVTIKTWEREITITGVKKYLRNHLLQSLKNDFSTAFPAFKKKNTGFFSLPRMIFPYITFLGALYKGSDETSSSLSFMLDYMGQISKVYKLRSGLDYIAYRHGLLHTQMPKIFSYGRKKLGWRVSYIDATEFQRDDFLKGNLHMYPKLYFSDLCQAIELYIGDFDNAKKQTQLFTNFKKTFTEMSKIFLVKDLKTKPSTKVLLRRGLRAYSM